MRHPRLLSHLLRPGLLAFVAAFYALWPVSAQQFPADPVRELRQALQVPYQSAAPRDRKLTQCIQALDSLGDLRRALALDEWRDEDPDPELATADRIHRAVVARRFEQALRAMLRDGDTTRRLWAINLLGEVGVSLRDVDTKRGLAHRLGPDLVALTTQRDAAVRAAAVNALARINPDPDVAVPAFAALLASGDLGQRLSGASGLAELMRTMCQMVTVRRASTGVEATPNEAVQLGRAVVPLAIRGLRDADPRVRCSSVAALDQAAAVLSHLLLDCCLSREVVEPGADPKGLAARQAEELLPLVLALQKAGPALLPVLRDADTAVRLQAHRALEQLSRAQATVPSVLPAGRIIPPELGCAFSGYDPNESASPATQAGHTESASPSQEVTIQALVVGLSDRDVRGRLRAIDVLEVMGPTAAPAAPALVKALSDPDRFVRWAAARTLGKIGPVKPATAVPSLARLLSDTDPDVRLAAIRTLRGYGAEARDALPALLGVFKSDQGEARLAVIQTLEAMGPEAQPARPALRAALADADTRVRQAAAVALSALDPATPQVPHP